VGILESLVQMMDMIRIKVTNTVHSCAVGGRFFKVDFDALPGPHPTQWPPLGHKRATSYCFTLW
jgi:hypothetical protein